MTEQVRERRPRRSFSKQFKDEVVDLVRTSGKSVAGVARDLDLTETAVREWVRQAEVDAGQRAGLTTAEREELSALRTENRTVREERDILKRPAPCSRFPGPLAGLPVAGRLRGAAQSSQAGCVSPPWRRPLPGIRQGGG